MRRQPRFLVTSLAALVGLVAAPGTRAAEPGKEAPTPTFEVEAHRDVAYRTGADADAVRHRLDLFLPKGRRDYPVVMIVHGGAWMVGNKSFFGLYSAVGQFLASRGVGVVLPNYRLSPAVKHPEHVRDVARAFGWTCRNIGKYGGRPDRLFVAGHSAGGHLAALLTTDETYLKAEGLEPANLRGVIAISGVYRIPDVDWDLLLDQGGVKTNLRLGNTGMLPELTLNLTLPEGPRMAGGHGMRFGPLHPVFGNDPKVRQAASPLAHVRPGLPPFLILYADWEYPLLPQMAEDFHRALQKNQCDTTLRKIDNRWHNDILFRAVRDDDPVARALLNFVAAHAK